MKSPITTHVLNIAEGKPAEGIAVTLEQKLNEKEWRMVGSGRTNSDGRILDLVQSDRALEQGQFRMTFETGPYFESRKQKSFYPSVVIQFVVQNQKEHYHVPLLLSHYGYSTYRGS